VKLFFKEVGATLGIAEIFVYIASCFDLDGDAAALERRTKTKNTLAMGVVEALRNAKERGEAASDPFVVVVQGGIGRVVAGGFGFAVVIANHGANDAAVATIEACNIPV
jgi:hypothetical protein